MFDDDKNRDDANDNNNDIINILAERVKTENLKITCIPTSFQVNNNNSNIKNNNFRGVIIS